MLRYSNQNQRITFSDRLLINKYDEKKTKEILDELADELLDDLPPLDDEIDDACDLIVTMTKTASKFNQSLLKVLSDSSIKIQNSDDVKYYLCKSRYYEHFIHGDNERFKVEHCQIIKILLEKFHPINVDDLIENRIGAINSLRTQLINKKPMGPYIDSRVNRALLILAKYWPLNAECPITSDNIEPKDRVFTTRGHQFNLPALLQYHEVDKRALNPIPSLRFSDFDLEHINTMSVRGVIRDLYDLQTIDVQEELDGLLHGIDYAHGEIPLKRLARLDKPTQDRLVQNLLKLHYLCEWMGGRIPCNDFASNLNGLMIRGLSIEKFASFDSEKQEALALSNPNAWYLIEKGVNADKLFELSASNLNAFFEDIPSSVDRLMKIFNEDLETINELNQRIDELLISQYQSNRFREVD